VLGMSPREGHGQAAEMTLQMSGVVWMSVSSWRGPGCLAQGCVCHTVTGVDGVLHSGFS
jgi:hypothetical protein